MSLLEHVQASVKATSTADDIRTLEFIVRRVVVFNRRHEVFLFDLDLGPKRRMFSPLQSQDISHTRRCPPKPLRFSSIVPQQRDDETFSIQIFYLHDGESDAEV